MIDPDGENISRLEDAAAPAPAEDLPYRVELWDLPGLRVERVLARAATLVLARPIFAAARIEHFGRRITLARGETVIEQTD